jgi:hypothetical protein
LLLFRETVVPKHPDRSATLLDQLAWRVWHICEEYPAHGEETDTFRALCRISNQHAEALTSQVTRGVELGKLVN